MNLDGAPLTVSLEAKGPEAVLVLAGELDPASAPLLDKAVDDLVTGGAEALTVDMAGVSFIDSSGLRSLISAQKKFDPAVMVLRAPTPFARQLLSITGLDQHFRIEPDDADGS